MSDRLSLLEARMTGNKDGETLPSFPSPMLTPSVLTRANSATSQGSFVHQPIVDIEDDDVIDESENDDAEGQSNPSTNTRKRKNFSQQEDEVLLKAFKTHGPNFEEIVKATGLDRTPNQLRMRMKRINKQITQPKIDDRKETWTQTLPTAETQELQKKCLDLETKMAEMQKKLDEKDKSLSDLEAKLSQTSQATETRKKKYMSVLKQHLEIINTRNAKEAREKSAQDNARIGTISYQRVGHEIAEVWEYGYLFHTLTNRQTVIADELKNLEKLKRSISKKRSSGEPHDSMPPPAESPSSDGATDERYNMEQEEILKHRVLQLKKEEQEITAQLEKLDAEKNLHVTEVRRIRNEDRSMFKINQVVHDRYLIQQLLGKGGFSEVFKAYDLVECREVSCKVHQLISHWSVEKKENYIKHAVRECNIQKSMQHSRIVQLYDVFEINRDAFCTVLEYCDGGDLDKVLKNQKIIPEKEARLITIQIFSGLVYLNQLRQPIIHYDLKPGNILFKNGEV
eukprot:TRINITY_DN673_c0_g2_i3.p1 TRINITY_DN673_c0_g2~~TRINITY_DN673_c0_g2_i3.p1  ORF type:complete len:511 (-),score=119.05 TRINITY_DN673_c0_g2_i3:782-2314(-)